MHIYFRKFSMYKLPAVYIHTYVQRVKACFCFLFVPPLFPCGARYTSDFRFGYSLSTPHSRAFLLSVSVVCAVRDISLSWYLPSVKAARSDVWQRLADLHALCKRA